MVCSRRYFESKLERCTIAFPKEDDYERLIEYIPNYIEDNIIISIHNKINEFKFSYDKQKQIKLSLKIKSLLYGKYNIPEKPEEKIKDIIELLRLKEKAKEKSIDFAGIKEELENISLVNEDLLNSKYLKKYVGAKENDIVSELFSILECLLKKNSKIKYSDIPYDLFNVLTILYKKRVKITNENSKEPIGELYYFDTDSKQNTNFVRTFSEIDKDGLTHGVVFHFVDENNNEIKGTLPISEEKKDVIDSSFGTK